MNNKRTTAAARELEESIFVTDGELLDQFSRSRSESAFAELVQRHGRLVQGVCRQILRHDQDVEDAFQATFLILAMRSRHIKKASSVGSWLYRVAYRTSMRLIRNRKTLPELSDEAPEYTDDPLERIHFEAVTKTLHEELVRLPSQYQGPLVLCYLQNMTRQQAADHLESTEASVKARLARGRRMLRLRLAKRGVGLSVAIGTVATHLAATGNSEAAELFDTTVEICTSNTSLTNPIVDLSSNTITLANQGISTMFYSSLAKPLAALLTVSAISIGFSIQNPIVWGQVDAEDVGTQVVADQLFVQSGEPSDESADAFASTGLADDLRFGETAKASRNPYQVSALTGKPSDNNNNLQRLRINAIYLKKKHAAYQKLAKAMKQKIAESKGEADKLESQAKFELYEAEANRIEGVLELVTKQIKATKPKRVESTNSGTFGQKSGDFGQFNNAASGAAPAGRDVFGAADAAHEPNSHPQKTQPVPCCRTNNLALNKKTTASSEELARNNRAKFATDGDLSTRWCANGSNAPEWLMVDLGQPLNFKGIRLHWEMKDSIAYRYQIQVSKDRKSWDTIVDASKNEKKGHMTSHEVDAQNARYIKIEYLGATSGFWGSIREVEVASRKLSAEPKNAWKKINSRSSFSDDLFGAAVDSEPSSSFGGGGGFSDDAAGTDDFEDLFGN